MCNHYIKTYLKIKYICIQIQRHSKYMKGYTYWEPLGWIEKKEIKGNHCVYMENPKRDQ